jgi:integrase
LWTLKKNGYSEATLKAKGERLKYSAKHVSLDDPETVKEYTAIKQTGITLTNREWRMFNNNYVEINDLHWALPHNRVEDKLPKIPTEEKINQIIVRARGKYVLVFYILRDTGMRPIELERTKVRDIDLDTGVITVRTAKGGAGRIVK